MYVQSTARTITESTFVQSTECNNGECMYDVVHLYRVQSAITESACMRVRLYREQRTITESTCMMYTCTEYGVQCIDFLLLLFCLCLNFEMHSAQFTIHFR